MSNQPRLDEELERRLSEIESTELADPAHAALSGRSLALFLAVVAGVVAVAWIGSAL